MRILGRDQEDYSWKRDVEMIKELARGPSLLFNTVSNTITVGLWSFQVSMQLMDGIHSRKGAT